jgi:prophage DNA circulation protein
MKYFEAKLDGFVLNIFDITDTLPQSIVRHEFISSDGAIVENYGLKAREISFKALFFGATYADHFTFVDKITNTDAIHTLVHPKYGELYGYIQETAIMHDDTQDYVEISISFVEYKLSQDSFLSKSAWQTINELQLQAMNNALATAGTLVGKASGLTGKLVSFNTSLRSQITGVTSKVSTFLTTLDTFFTAVDSIADTITSPLVAINNAVSFTQDVPGKLCSTVFNATNRITSSLIAIKNVPINFVNGLIAGARNFDKLVAYLGSKDGETNDLLRKACHTIAATNVAVQTMAVLQADENNRATAKSMENKRAFDANGVRINNIDIPEAMSVQAIEQILYEVRVYIQECVDYDRDNRDLKNIAWALVKYVDEIKLSKRSQVTMTVTSIPLHLLCMQLGLPYNAADRILKINPAIKNPTFTQGQIQVYVN